MMMLMASRQRVHGIQRAEGVSRGDFIAFMCNSIVKLLPAPRHTRELSHLRSQHQNEEKRKDKISFQKKTHTADRCRRLPHSHLIW